MHMPDESGRPERPEERQGSAALREGGLKGAPDRFFGQGAGICYALRQHKHQTDKGGGLGRGGVCVSWG